MQIVKIEGETARSVIESLSGLDPATVYSLRVAFDDGAVKFKINERAWSPPYGFVTCHWCDGRCVLVQHEAGHTQPEDCRCDRHAIPSHRTAAIDTTERDAECLGHEPGPNEPMGISTYCDGACQSG